MAACCRGLDALGRKAKAPPVDLPIESVSLSLRDLIGYLHPPAEHLEHEDKQNRLRALKNRQNLFQEEVSLRQRPSFPLCSWAEQSLVGSSVCAMLPLAVCSSGRAALFAGTRPWGAGGDRLPVGA